VQNALRKNRNERYQTIKEMLADLRELKEKPELEAASRAEPIFSKIKRHKRGALLILAAAMLAAAAVAYHFYFATPAPLPNEKSIAVLPFADLSQGRDQEYSAMGFRRKFSTDSPKSVISKSFHEHRRNGSKARRRNCPKLRGNLRSQIFSRALFRRRKVRFA